MARYFSGRSVVCYVKKEATYNVAVTCAGTDAFLTLSETMTPIEEREVRPDRTGSPSHLERFVGRNSASWDISTLILPSGSVTTEPDNSLLWEAGFGRISINTTAVEYSLATGNNQSLTIRRGIRMGTSDNEAEYQEHVSGACVTQIEIGWGNQGNSNLARVNFTGLAANWGFTGNGTLNKTSGVITSAVTCANFSGVNVKHFSVGSQIAIGPANKHVKGQSLSISTLNFTLKRFGIRSTSHATNYAGATHTHLDQIRAYNPTAVTTGTPVHGKVGFLSLDGSATKILHVGGRVTLATGRMLVNEEVGSSTPTDITQGGKRDVTFSLEFLAKSTETPALLHAMRTNVAQNIQINVGEGSNKTMKIHMVNAEFDMAASNLPEADMMRWTMSGRALGTRANNELKVRLL